MRTIPFGRNPRDLRTLTALFDRFQLAQQLNMSFGDKTRDVYAAAGYDKLITFPQYVERYRRGDIARRIVDIYAVETWRKMPYLLDGVDAGAANDATPFTLAWLRLAQSEANGAETRRGLAHYLTRLDRAANLGRYAVLYLGLADGLAAEQPAIADSLTDPGDLLFVSVFDEGTAQVAQYETDMQSPRYGLPVTYNLTDAGENRTRASFTAHWTRCIHVADGVLTSDLFGTPVLEAVWNRLLDLEKVMAATGEGGWTQMQPGYIFSTKEGYDLDEDGKDLRQEQIDEFVHGLRRFMELNGYDTTMLAGDLQDPTGAVDNFLKLISAATGIPLRKLIGSERGELASSQDDDNWIDIIEARQEQHVGPAIIQPVVNRLLWLGVLPPPTTGKYTVWWPSLRNKSQKEQAEIADRNAAALQKIGARVEPAQFAATYLPDLPAGAVSAPPKPAGGDQTATSGEGGGPATNAAQPFRYWVNYP